jgi:hypothetical protein
MGSKKIVVVGGVAAGASCALLQNGFDVKNLPGGFRAYRFVSGSLPTSALS